MGNQPSTPSSSGKRRSSRSGPETTAERVKKVVDEVHEEIKRSVKRLDDDHPAAALIDSMCGTGYFDDDASRGYRRGRAASYSEYSEDEDGSRTISEDDTYDDRSRRSRADNTVESQSYMSQSDYESDHRHKKNGGNRSSFDTEDESRADTAKDPANNLQKQPLASSFAKRCYFTKAGIGRTTQHYEGLTLTGNVVLMLAAAMKLKGCPTICDEDLRRVEQTYPNQFSRLPDELLLSSGWRRVSKYCHFSNKPIPDGVPFFHSKQRLHPSGGYYFLLAAAVGMARPLDVDPLTKDTLVLLETDYPTQCDAAPSVLIKDPKQWTLVNKFCFFSGGPINTEEDVYYQADFDGNPIFMLAFLSPSLTPQELYKLGERGEPTLNTIAAVQEVESVYDLTARDFDDLKLYHLGPCRALPQYILQPQAWTKILPPHFLAARQQARIRAEEYMQRYGIPIDAPAPMDGVNEPMYPLDPPDDQPPSLQKMGVDPGVVPDPEDPSVVQTPVAQDPSVHDAQMHVQTEQGPVSPTDEQQSAMLISLGSPATAAHYDPFAGLDQQPSHDLLGPPPEPQQQPPPMAVPPPEATPSYPMDKPALQPLDIMDSNMVPEPENETPRGHYPMSPPDEDEAILYGEEKKVVGVDESSGADPPNHGLMMQISQESDLKSGEGDFIPIKRDGYRLTTTGPENTAPPVMASPASVTSEGSHTSAALRGAQEILKRNRRRRAEMAKPNQPEPYEENPDPSTPQVLQETDTWASESDILGSTISGSSVWSNDSGTTGDKSSRRALILQMAKARMRNNKESPTKASVTGSMAGPTITEEEDSLGAPTDTNTDIDFAGDLD
eukprot:Nitzschia sp. Nitz4//scaffold95_size97785//40770//43490//NITZ4_004665-RA/size97785-augustus-gene-0.98-mRNA-1//1//CDS//3329560466//2055//frame0